MRDPERLLDADSTTLEHVLLRAGVDEEPPAGGRERLRALLGVSAGVAVGTTGAKAAAATGTRVAASKLAVIAGVMGGVAVAAYVATQVVGHSPVPAPGAHTTAGFVAPPGHAPIAPPGPAPIAPPSPSQDAVPAVAEPVLRAPVDAPSPASAPAERPATARSIAEEIRALDVARRSLAGGNVGPAISALNGYDRAHPAGMLRQEATLLRIEALVRSGDRAAARRLGERFLRSHPGSPHERRIRALLGDAAP